MSALLYRCHFYGITAQKCIENWIILSLCKILSLNQQKYKEHRNHPSFFSERRKNYHVFNKGSSIYDVHTEGGGGGVTKRGPKMWTGVDAKTGGGCIECMDVHKKKNKL